MASWKKVLVSGSAGEFSSITASVGLQVGTNQTISTTSAILTGSLFGTASWASNVVTASYITGSVFTSTNPALSASYAATASFALNAVGGTLNISASTIAGAGGGNTSINLPTALIVSGTLNEIEVSANNGILQIGLPNNVTIGGNLSVTGTTTTVSASSLLVTDKFIILSSGSTQNNDGGIIIQNAITNGTGSGYGFILDGAQDITAPRWGVTSSLSPTASNLTTPDEYMVSAKRAPGAPSNSTPPTYGGSAKGYGNIYINETTGDIWIYSEQ